MKQHDFAQPERLPDALEFADANDLIVMHQDQYNQWLRAKDALDALAWLFAEVATKAMGHPKKDGYTSVPAASMAALVWCVQGQLTPDDSKTMGHVLHLRPELAGGGDA
jgi:hypothetical protein